MRLPRFGVILAHAHAVVPRPFPPSPERPGNEANSVRTYNRYTHTIYTHTIHFAVWIDTFSRDPVYILWGARGPAKIRIIYVDVRPKTLKNPTTRTKSEFMATLDSEARRQEKLRMRGEGD